MSYGALGPQPHQIGNPAYFQSAGGAKLIARIPLFAGSTNGVVPPNAGWISARGVGAGGGSDSGGSNSGGGGAAFAREDRACSAGQAYTAVVGAGVVKGNGGTTTLTLGGTLILSAEGGRKGGTGGQAANSLGTIRSSGGTGSPSTSGTAGQNGAPGGSGNGGAGGSAGERNVADALIVGGPGRAFSGTAVSQGDFPGGGGQFFYDNGGGLNDTAGGAGFMFLEFWSAKP